MSQRITPEDLVKDPSILLRKKGDDSSEALCSFEGQVGAVIWEGSHFVTSPNMDHIWEPPRVSRITYMQDMRYGEHDPLQWPQPFIGSFCYLAAIRRRPDDLRSSNRFFIAFYQLQDSDLLAQEGALSGLYTLTPRVVSLAKAFVQSRVVEKFKEYENKDDAPKNDILLKLLPSIHRTVNHLENLPMTRRQIRFLFSELQRYFLEFTAAFEYLTIYLPRIKGTMPAATTVTKKLMGAFVQTAADADDLFRAGIPIWVIREAKWAGNDRVDSLCEVQKPQDYLCLDSAFSHFPVDYRDSLTNANKYITFGRFARGFLSYGNAYNGRTYEAPIAQPAGSEQSTSAFRIGPRAAMSHELRKSKQPYPVPQRRDFSEPVSHYLPPSQEAWASGLCKINTDPKRSFLVARSMSQGGFILPDPAAFIGVTTSNKREIYITNWLKYRSALMYRLTESQGRSPLSSQLWRDLLRLPLDALPSTVTQPAATTSSSTSTRKSSKSSQRGEILLRIFENFDFHASGVAVNGHEYQVAWRGQALIKGDEPDPNMVREVLWELSELNFQFDLIALDHHLYRATLKADREGHHDILQSREDDILLCFAGGSLGTSPFVANIANADIGIAAADWMVRRAYIIYLRNAMRDWEGFDSAAKQCREVDLFTRSGDILCFAEHQYLLFETVLVRLLIQLFYDAFGRAIVIPRRIH